MAALLKANTRYILFAQMTKTPKSLKVLLCNEERLFPECLYLEFGGKIS